MADGVDEGSAAMLGSIALWDAVHPYYCNEGNYFASSVECHAHFERWQDFIEEEGNADLDMNLVFRWDWESPRKGYGPDSPIEWNGDPYYRDSTLKLFYLGQRKGIYRWVTVSVCRADEPAIREWLQVRFDHLMKLWAPFKQ